MPKSWLKYFLSQEKIKEWAWRHAKTKKAGLFLLVVAFCESSFFLIPVDVVLIALLTIVPARWLYFSVLSTVGSVLGGVFAYAVGFFFFETVGVWIIDTYNLAAEVARIGVLFADNSFLTIFVASFTPLPYKLFTISAGFFQINIWIFILASLLGRGLRFALIGYFMKYLGPIIGRLVYRYFNLILIVSLIIVIMSILYFFII